MDERRSRFERLYAHYRPHVEAYVRRRLPEPAVADVVADCFLVAWRRLDHIPADALPWLYATARNRIGTQYRSDARRAALRDRLAAQPAVTAPSSDGPGSAELLAVADTLAELDDSHQEVLLLAAWEELTPVEIGAVLDITPNAASVRLHRARSRLRAAVAALDESDEHEVTDR